MITATYAKNCDICQLPLLKDGGIYNSVQVSLEELNKCKTLKDIESIFELTKFYEVVDFINPDEYSIKVKRLK